VAARALANEGVRIGKIRIMKSIEALARVNARIPVGFRPHARSPREE
jgi:hypothetical protein